MKSTIEKVRFTNREGLELSAVVEFPPDHKPRSFALFAHCFTCGKNLLIARHISRALTSSGFAVMAFDFTGLGSSEGDFAKTDFSSNVEDILDALDFLKAEYGKPSLLIGHSLGGAAVLMAAEKNKEIQVVTTIGAPFDPEHVTHLFTDQWEVIKTQGFADVPIGSKTVRISKKFIENLDQVSAKEYIGRLRKPLLIFHSPQDDIVGVDNARKIYESAFHPKSFVSLDGADHLLSKKEDAIYTGQVMAAWASRYVEIASDVELITEQQVVSSTGEKSYTTTIRAGDHYITADEPADVGGFNLGPTPYGLLMASLGSCTGMTLRMYADRKGWPLEEVLVHLNHEKVHATDSESNDKIDRITRFLEVKGNLTSEQKDRLFEMANKCPVHRTLHGPLEVTTQWLSDSH